jgi:hypothetical protein
MSDVFPKWTNKLPAQILLGLAMVGTAVVCGVTYYATPKYTDVGYQPIQPVYFPHSVHADQLGIDCRYCHNQVEKSWYSNLPGPGVCMNCHNQVLANDTRLAPIRESAQNGKPIPWVQIHKLPDFVYFNHSVHVNGEVHKMDEVAQAKPLSMSFCLECHRAPEKNLRPPEQVFNLDWKPPANFARNQGEQFKHDWNVHAAQSCSACHR